MCQYIFKNFHINGKIATEIVLHDIVSNPYHFHENPNTNCPVGRNIHHVLDDKLMRVQRAMEQELASITLADVKKDVKKYIQN